MENMAERESRQWGIQALMNDIRKVFFFWIGLIFVIFFILAATFIAFCFIEPNPKLLTNKELEDKVLIAINCDLAKEFFDAEKMSVSINGRATKGLILGIINTEEKIVGYSKIPFSGEILYEKNNKRTTFSIYGQEGLIGDERKIHEINYDFSRKHKEVNKACLK